jgi:hypothetical protein
MLSPARTQEIAAGFMQRSSRNGQVQPTVPTPSQVRRLQTWLVIFWMNQELRSELERYLRSRGDRRGDRRRAMRSYLVDRDQEMDKYEDQSLQVKSHVFRFDKGTWLTQPFVSRV